MAEAGHIGDLWELQPQATRRVLIGFFDTGTVDGSLYKYEPMEFNASWGYPLLALGGLAWLTVRLVRYFRRRRGPGQGEPTIEDSVAQD